MAKPPSSNGSVNAAYTLAGLTVKGFKSIRDEAAVELRPLTVMAGANSSGKSTFMQPLLLLKQTLQASFNPAGALLMDGPYVKLPEIQQCFSAGQNGTRQDSFSVGFSFRDDTSVAVRYGADSGMQPVVLDSTQTVPRGPFVLRPQMKAQEIAALFRKAGMTYPTGAVLWRVVSTRGFLELRREGGGVLSLVPVPQAKFNIEQAIYIPSYRGNPDRSFPAASLVPPYAGAFLNYVASFIHSWQEAGDPDHFLASVTNSLGELGLTHKVRTVKVSGTHFEIRVGRTNEIKGKNDLVSLSDVGFGVSQVLPVLVALQVAKLGQIVYIEEPDADLHPRAQVRLAKLLADASKRGVILVVETHSSLLLQGITTLVAEGKLDNSLVKLHWFQRGKSGFTKVHSANLDRQGRYGKWPADFHEVNLDSESAYLDAVSASHK